MPQAIRPAGRPRMRPDANTIDVAIERMAAGSADDATREGAVRAVVEYFERLFADAGLDKDPAVRDWLDALGRQA